MKKKIQKKEKKKRIFTPKFSLAPKKILFWLRARLCMKSERVF